MSYTENKYSFEMLTNDLQILERTLIADATALEQYRDDLGSLLTQTQDLVDFSQHNALSRIVT